MESPFRIADLDRPAPRPSSRDEVVIGVATRPRDVTGHCDVLLTAGSEAPRPWVACADPYTTARRIGRIVARQPAAALALVHVLRMRRALPPPDRLLVESLAYSALQGGAGFRTWLATAPPRTARPVAEPVRVHREGDRLAVVLNRPRVRNAFDAATRDALCEALEVAVADPSITRVDLRGSGPVFCSGGDLAEFGSSRDPAEAHLVRTRRSPAALLLRCSPKVTAHLHGACVGAGIELAAFAGRVVASPGTTVRLPEVGMGLIPGAGGTVSLADRVGRRRTAYLALSGIALTAAEALRWGLVDEVAPPPAERRLGNAVQD